SVSFFHAKLLWTSGSNFEANEQSPTNYPSALNTQHYYKRTVRTFLNGQSSFFSSMSASSSSTATMIETERLQPPIDAHDEEDSPTDTTNPAFPDESPTLPPTPGDNNGPENSDPTPARPLSPHNQSSAQHATLVSLTRTSNRPDLHLQSMTAVSNNTTSSYNNNSSHYFQVTSPQTNAFTPTGPSSPGRASNRIVATQPIANQRPIDGQSAIITRRHNSHGHRGEGRRNHQEPNIPTAPPVPHAPAPSMYWSKVKTFGKAPKTLRAHTVNLVGESMYVFGGCDARTCFNTVYVFDADTMYWNKPRTLGEPPKPCRAHSSTLVDKKLFVFGGGDGPDAELTCLLSKNLDTLTWTKPSTSGSVPSPRRAHTAAYYNECIYVFGGGDGARALNDVHVLKISDLNNLEWKKLELKGRPPISRGYHTSNLVGNKLVVYGGSDGHECFSDVHVLDLEKSTWTQIDVANSHKRLSHTATQVGSYLFVVCGHDGGKYTSEVQLLNLVTMEWETRKVYGTPPSGRGYHTTVLYDSRLFVFGGYDGHTVFDDVYVLDLSACAYLPQIINFQLPERS
ncbi:10531_t:CDS:2, partial [Acaulospora morrowiae]